MHRIRHLATGLFLAGASLCASAGTLFEQLPDYAAGGIGSDVTTTIDGELATLFTQGFAAPSGATLERIVWWGSNTFGSGSAFQVVLDGAVVFEGDDSSGLLTVAADQGITLYTLDIADILLTATSIGIWNTDLDSTWAWQTSSQPGVDLTAFRLEGSLLNAVPEPSTLLLAAGAVLALRLTRRRAVPAVVRTA